MKQVKTVDSFLSKIRNLTPGPLYELAVHPCKIGKTLRVRILKCEYPHIRCEFFIERSPVNAAEFLGKALHALCEVENKRKDD